MLNSLCRACLSFSNNEKLVPLLDKSEKNGLSCYGQAMMVFANVTIQKDDIFPKAVCYYCFQLLKNAILFKFRCESSQNKLQVLIEKTKASSDEEIQKFIAEILLFESYFPSADVAGGKQKNYAVLQSVTKGSKKKVIEKRHSNDSKKNNITVENLSDSAEVVKKNMSILDDIEESMYIDNKLSKEILGDIGDVYYDSEIYNSNAEGESDNNSSVILDEFQALLQIKPNIFGRKMKYSKKKFKKNTDETAANWYSNDLEEVINENADLEKTLCDEYVKTESTSCNIESIIMKSRKIERLKKKHKSQKHMNKNTETINLENEREERSIRKNYKRNLTCHICKKVLANSTTYKQHMQTHEGCEFTCEKCGKSYPALSSLQFHQTTKHGIGSFIECKMCSFKAPSKVYLVEHERLHTGERPFTCEKCGLSFRRRAIWKKHLLHHSEKTVKCNQCPKMFYQTSEMVTHCNNVHERKYMYVCPKCGALYAKNTTVRRHLAERHGIPRAEQGKIERIGKDKGLFTAVRQQ